VLPAPGDEDRLRDSEFCSMTVRTGPDDNTPARNTLRDGTAKSMRRRAVANIAQWADAIKGGPKPGSSFEYSGPMTETCLLGVLAERFGGRIEWDAEKMEITNRPELNAYVKETPRQGW